MMLGMVNAGDPLFRRGFTLTEIAIVLGIIGLILGAIWTAAASVYLNHAIKKAEQQILTIVGNMRSLYPTGFSSAVQADITCDVIPAGVFPSDMVLPGPCVPLDLATYPRDPWGGAVRILSSSSAPDGPNTGEFELFYAAIGGSMTQGACITILAFLGGLQGIGGPTYLFDDNSGWQKVAGANLTVSNFYCWPGFIYFDSLWQLY